MTAQRNVNKKYVLKKNFLLYACWLTMLYFKFFNQITRQCTIPQNFKLRPMR